MATLTGDEVLQKRIDVLGSNLGPLFGHIENDLYSLRSDWRLYTAWFSTNPERVDLLNNASAQTARVLQNTLFCTVMLSLCRLTDPPSSTRGKTLNISVSRLPEMIKDHPKSAELAKLVESAQRLASFARSWRNKRLAHSDENVRFGRAKVDAATHDKMNQAINAIAAVVKWVGSNMMDTHIVTHPIAEFSGDEVSFLEILHEGVIARARNRELAKELHKKGDPDQASELLSYPKWLSFRPKDDID